MVKRYINMALVYPIIAMIFGVFYREFTKFSYCTGQTNLSVIHTHYFLLGMFFFLALLLAEKVFSFSNQKTGMLLIAYQIGLNITGLSGGRLDGSFATQNKKTSDLGGPNAKIIPRVTPKYLLLIAGIVWMFAGGNILRLGIPDFTQY